LSPKNVIVMGRDLFKKALKWLLKSEKAMAIFDKIKLFQFYFILLNERKAKNLKMEQP